MGCGSLSDLEEMDGGSISGSGKMDRCSIQ